MLCNDKGDKEMKYIRTNDGVYKFEDFTKTRGEVCLNHYGYQTKDGVCLLGTLAEWKKDGKFANNIEKLFDKYVVVKQFDDFKKIGSFYECEYEIDCFKRKIKSNNPILAIYGAIWTEWGLKYAAKMKGVLPNGEIDWELL